MLNLPLKAHLILQGYSQCKKLRSIISFDVIIRYKLCWETKSPLKSGFGFTGVIILPSKFKYVKSPKPHSLLDVVSCSCIKVCSRAYSCQKSGFKYSTIIGRYYLPRKKRTMKLMKKPSTIQQRRSV